MNARGGIISVFLAAALFSVAPPTLAQKGPIILKITDSLSKGHVMYDITLSVMIPALEEGGKIKVQYFPGNQLGKMADVIETVRSGIADIGQIVPGIVPGKMPVSSIVSLPGQFTSGEKLAAGGIRLARSSLKQEYDKLGIKIIAVAGTPVYQFFTRTKVVRVPADVKGLKIRGGGGDADDYLRDNGVIIVNVPSPQLYEALQKGVIDGALYTQATAVASHLVEVTKYATEGAPLAGLIGLYFVDQKKFDAFPPDIQAIIVRAGEKAGTAMGKEYDRREAEGKAAFLAAGGKVNPLTADENRQWRELYKDAPDKMIKKMESRGFKYARQVYDEMRKVRTEVGER